MHREREKDTFKSREVKCLKECALALISLYNTIQRLMLSKGAKRTTIVTVIIQYVLDKTTSRSGEMYKDDEGIFSLVINFIGISNTSVQNFAIRISSVKTVPKCLRKLKAF